MKLLSHFLVPMICLYSLPRLAESQWAEGTLVWRFSSGQREGQAQSRVESFPHRFDSLVEPAEREGQYSTSSLIPAELTGMPLLLDLGPIDDSDVPSFNGEVVGRTGSFNDANEAVWLLDRRYRVAPKHIKYGETNEVAVRVKNFGGLGGIMGQPYIGAILLPPEEEKDLTWRCAADRAPESAWTEPDFDESGWEGVKVPDTGLKKRRRGTEGYERYRLRFSLPEGLQDKRLVLDLGPVYDACRVWLNGKPVARIGQFPPRYIPLTTKRVRFMAPAHLVKGQNTLAVLAYYRLSDVPKGVDRLPTFDKTRQQGGAGLPGYPTVAFMTTYALEEADWGARLGNASPELTLELSDLHLNAQQPEKARGLLQRLSPPELNDELRSRRLDRLIRLACLTAKSAKAADLLGEFVKKLPRESLSLETSYRLHYALRWTSDLDGGVVWLGEDRYTRGTNEGTYGSAGYIYCAWNAPKSLRHPYWPGRGVRMSYELRSPDHDDTVRAWLAHGSTDDPRVLAAGTRKNGRPARRYACWDDHGETHPFDNEGPDILIDLDIPDGDYVLSFYHLDYDWYNGEHPRLMSILLTDREAGQPLNIVPTGRCGEGIYERFYVEGPREITARIVKHRSPCAVVSGVFLDPVPIWPEASQVLEGEAEGLEELRQLYNGDRADFYRQLQPHFGAAAGKFSHLRTPRAIWHRAWLHIVNLYPDSGTRIIRCYVAQEGERLMGRQLAFALRNAWDGLFGANKWTFGRALLDDAAHDLLKLTQREE